MVIKPGLIGNGRKTILGDGVLKSSAKNCALQKPSLDRRKTPRLETGWSVSGYRIDRPFWTNPAT
jgi:hypothetical protein